MLVESSKIRDAATTLSELRDGNRRKTRRKTKKRRKRKTKKRRKRKKTKRKK